MRIDILIQLMCESCKLFSKLYNNSFLKDIQFCFVESSNIIIEKIKEYYIKIKRILCNRIKCKSLIVNINNCLFILKCQGVNCEIKYQEIK